MLDRQFGFIVFECDGQYCTEFLESGTRDFSEAVDELNEAGWVARKSNDQWLHICPDCLKDEGPAL
jgi:hypothetical protein